MTLRFSLVLFLLFALGLRVEAQAYYDPKPMVRHHVATYTATQFDARKGKLKKQGVVKETGAYDSLNRLLVHERYSLGPDNHVFMEEKPVYDSAGQLSYVVCWNRMLACMSFLRYPVYEGGRKIAEIDSAATRVRLLRRRTFSYDSVGQVIQVLTTDSLGKPMYKDTFCYNERGLVTEEITYLLMHGAPQQNKRLVNRYDGRGNMTQQIVYHYTIEKPMATIHFFYDDKGLLSFIRAFNSDGELYAETRYSYTFYR